ncbi:MAG: universal stress protein, partial [Myxococcota bacterium]
TAVTLAERLDAQLIVLRVLTKGASLEPGDAEIDLNVIELETKELLAEALAQLTPGTPPDRVQAEVRAGQVVPVILEAANDWQADLVVVGSHGRHRPLEWWTGSTAEQLVAKLPGSVLVVKPEGFPFLTE